MREEAKEGLQWKQKWTRRKRNNKRLMNNERRG